MPTEPFNAFTMAQQQFDRVADLLELGESTRALLRNPLREYHFSIPVRMDDSTVRVFRGFRVQHNDARGPCKGGIRFHPQETVDTVRALAMWMTWSRVLDRAKLIDIRNADPQPFRGQDCIPAVLPTPPECPDRVASRTTPAGSAT